MAMELQRKSMDEVKEAREEEEIKERRELEETLSLIHICEKKKRSRREESSKKEIYLYNLHENERG
ncbi:hypothetical protein DEO72_LG11g2716 [Vigna unguiculata]|uniref:Uncharacterized protein n=1 Tax=Vigna unguiculata TaxID=3917 RepID=A0A4D6NSR0_VIGUN|nr:hypothetical protein DEO72_LG11g2716 [Vigna unguiculata]